MDLKQQEIFCRENYVKLLSIALKDILKYSRKEQCNNMSPRPDHHFVHQTDMTVGSYQNVLENKKSDESYEYCLILMSDPWKK
jgi:hypothetical protein